MLDQTAQTPISRMYLRSGPIARELLTSWHSTPSWLHWPGHWSQPAPAPLAALTSSHSASSPGSTSTPASRRIFSRLLAKILLNPRVPAPRFNSHIQSKCILRVSVIPSSPFLLLLLLVLSWNELSETPESFMEGGGSRPPLLALRVIFRPFLDLD